MNIVSKSKYLKPWKLKEHIVPLVLLFTVLAMFLGVASMVLIPGAW